MGGFAQGWQTGENWAQHGAKHAQELSDEEHELKLNDFNNQIAGIKANMATVHPDSPEYGQYQDALSKATADRAMLFHPANGPNALARLGAMVLPHLFNAHAPQPTAAPATAPAATQAPTAPAATTPYTNELGATVNPGGYTNELGAVVPGTPAADDNGPAALKAKYAQLIGDPSIPRFVNPINKVRETLHEGGFNDADVEKGARIAANLEPKPIARQDTWSPKGNPFKGVDGKFYQRWTDKQGQEHDTPMDANYTAPIAKPSAAAMETAIRSYATEDGLDPDKITGTQRDGYIARFQQLMHPDTISSHQVELPDANGGFVKDTVSSSSRKNFGAKAPAASGTGAPPATAGAAKSAVAAVRPPKATTAKPPNPSATVAAADDELPGLPGNGVPHRNTPAQTDARKLYDGAFALQHHADTINNMPRGTSRALQQKILLGAIQKNTEGRFNQAAYDNLFNRLGYRNGVAGALEKFKSGELPPEVWKAVSDVTKETLAAQRASLYSSYGVKEPSAKPKAKSGAKQLTDDEFLKLF